jgi:sugar phosphate isomerase/epimerase
VVDCVRHLKQAGFDGWCNIEYEGDEPAETAMPRGVAYSRKVLDAVSIDA